MNFIEALELKWFHSQATTCLLSILWVHLRNTSTLEVIVESLMFHIWVKQGSGESTQLLCLNAPLLLIPKP